MNNISKIHQRFSKRLNDSRVLTNPEEFLGPNYKAVLDFWLILDELTEDQCKTISRRYLEFYYKQQSEWQKAVDVAIEASEETIGWKFAFNAAEAAWEVSGWAADRATRELIGMHKILEQEKPLNFIPFAFKFQTFS